MNAGAELQQRGVALWLDTLGRDQLGSGEFAELIRDCSVTGVALDAGELLAGVATAKVRHACDVLGPVFDAAERADGYASIAIDPQLA
ncbi:MAG TPA: hypothetical protein VKB75_08740, partial [Jatrophihabitans sp.]|nr:hypothetical protein [Jatrophihabitans sp.]